MEKKIYINFLVREINKEIKKEENEKKKEENEKEENVFFFIKLYVKAMKIVEKEKEEQYNCFCKKNKNNFINFSDYLISLHELVFQRIWMFHINKKYIFL